MNDIAIQAEGLSKLYRIGERQVMYQTLRDVLAYKALKPARLLRSFTHRNGNQHESPNTFWALKDVSFDVKRGEILGIIGSNGAGKSTLLKILSRITLPTDGCARIHGRVGSLLEVGTGFHPELTGRENVYLNGAILGMKKNETARKFDEIVEFAGVEKFIDTPVKRYSSGMYLRLAFAVAAHLEPDILLIDEVLAVGDARFQKKCLGRVRAIASEGRTVLFISHNLPAIRSLCGSAILLNKGVIERMGIVTDVVQQYMVVATQASKKVWEKKERPGSDSVRLNSVSLLNATGQNISAVNLSEDLFVEICYEVIESGADVSFSLVLFDAEGTCLFGSVSNAAGPLDKRSLKCGNYKSTCRLNGNLLNEGRFFVSVIGFSTNFTESFRVDNVAFFDAIDDGLLRGDYYGGYGGPFRPKLNWETVSSS